MWIGTSQKSVSNVRRIDSNNEELCFECVRLNIESVAVEYGSVVCSEICLISCFGFLIEHSRNKDSTHKEPD